MSLCSSVLPRFLLPQIAVGVAFCGRRSWHDFPSNLLCGQSCLGVCKKNGRPRAAILVTNSNNYYKFLNQVPLLNGLTLAPLAFAFTLTMLSILTVLLAIPFLVKAVMNVILALLIFNVKSVNWSN